MISLIYLPLYLFFSSRRRHTRWPRDWSSDVCSSDLVLQLGDLLVHLVVRVLQGGLVAHLLQQGLQVRSEERRVGKECRFRRASVDEIEKQETSAGGETRGLTQVDSLSEVEKNVQA